MGNLIRRNKAVPVQVRRPAGHTESIHIPSTGMNPAPLSPGVFPPGTNAPPASGQPASGTTQNIFYITTPAAPPPAAQAPQEIHYHTVVHQAPRRTMIVKGASFLGLLAILSGGASCAAGYFPQIAPHAHLLAETGLVMGGLGWLGAILFRRTGSGIPIFGLLVSAAGYGLWMFGGKLPPLPKIDLGNSAARVIRIPCNSREEDSPRRHGEHGEEREINHGWTQMNTDKTNQILALNDLCPSVFIGG